MKKKINILCGLIICVITLCIIYPTYNLGHEFGTSLTSGYEALKANSNKQILLSNHTTITTAFKPKISKFISNPDSITCITNENIVPVVWERGSIFVPDNTIPTWYLILGIICELVTLVLFITLLIKFIKLIININKDFIFEQKNVKLIRHLGILLLIIASSQIIHGIASEILILLLPYKFEGYDISAYWNIPWYNITFGLVALLMAQIWARGIQMREEQELTI